MKDAIRSALRSVDTGMSAKQEEAAVEAVERAVRDCGVEVAASSVAEAASILLERRFAEETERLMRGGAQPGSPDPRGIFASGARECRGGASVGAADDEVK